VTNNITLRSRIARWIVVASLLLPVVAVGEASDFELFVTSESHVFQLDGEGHFGVFVTTSGDHWPLALTFDRAGVLYVSVTGTGDIHTFGRNGEDLGVFATIGGTNPFADLAFDAAGNLYATNFSTNEIWKFVPDGTGAVFALTGDGPTGLTVDAQGHLFVALINAGGGAVAEYSSGGTLLNTFPAAQAADVVSKDDVLWVLSSGTKDIRRYTTDGDLIDVFAGGFSDPAQMTFDTAGFVYVTDPPALVIRRFSPAGADLGALFPPLFFPSGLAFRPAQIDVAIDVKPGSCRNPFNVGSKGVLPVAVVGTASFDVARIDVSSLTLAGVAPIRTAFGDVTGPEGGACGVETGDGVKDLVLHFRTADLVENLAGPFVDGAQRRLTMTGRLKMQYGGTAFEGSDVVTLIAK
jgi:hypothetical protein